MRVVIVIGQEGSEGASKALRCRFFMESTALINRFTGDLEIPEKSISFTSLGGYRKTTAEDIRKELEEIILENPKEDLCLVYIGHGQDNGWALSGLKDKESIYYEELNLILALHDGKLIFLNSCCYGGAGADALAAHPDNSLLISPMPATHFGYIIGFFSDLIEKWKSGEFYKSGTPAGNTDSKSVVIGDSNLQKLFFLKNTARPKGGSNV